MRFSKSFSKVQAPYTTPYFTLYFHHPIMSNRLLSVPMPRHTPPHAGAGQQLLNSLVLLQQQQQQQQQEEEQQVPVTTTETSSGDKTFQSDDRVKILSPQGQPFATGIVRQVRLNFFD
jgi:hypothetical protein